MDDNLDKKMGFEDEPELNLFIDIPDSWSIEPLKVKGFFGNMQTDIQKLDSIIGKNVVQFESDRFGICSVTNLDEDSSYLMISTGTLDSKKLESSPIDFLMLNEATIHCIVAKTVHGQSSEEDAELKV